MRKGFLDAIQSLSTEEVAIYATVLALTERHGEASDPHIMTAFVCDLPEARVQETLERLEQLGLINRHPAGLSYAV